jgi:hypothetical protein
VGAKVAREEPWKATGDFSLIGYVKGATAGAVALFYCPGVSLAHTLAQPNKNSLSKEPFEALNQGSCWRRIGDSNTPTSLRRLRAQR